MLELIALNLLLLCIQMPNAIPYLQGRFAKLQRFQRNLSTIQKLHVLEMYREFQNIYKLNVLELPRTLQNLAKLALLPLCWLFNPKLWAIRIAYWADRNSRLASYLWICYISKVKSHRASPPPPLLSVSNVEL